MEYFQLTKEIIKEKTVKKEITESYLNEIKEAVVEEFNLNEHERNLIDTNFINFCFTIDYYHYNKLNDNQTELVDRSKNYEITIQEYIEEYIANDILDNGYEDESYCTYVKTREYEIVENED